MQIQKINYQKKLEEIIAREQTDGRVPTLLLHSCCAPCSSYVLEYLSEYFKITVLYYNPNISPAKEYEACLAGGDYSLVQSARSMLPMFFGSFRIS